MHLQSVSGSSPCHPGFSVVAASNYSGVSICIHIDVSFLVRIGFSIFLFFNLRNIILAPQYLPKALSVYV